jgi:nucleoid-associated protein YgaU
MLRAPGGHPGAFTGWFDGLVDPRARFCRGRSSRRSAQAVEARSRLMPPGREAFMKQNERILVYVVTGFLALILMVAVFFGGDASARLQQQAGAPGAGPATPAPSAPGASEAANANAAGLQGLREILGGQPAAGNGSTAAPPVANVGEAAPAHGAGTDGGAKAATPEHPLAAVPHALAAADLVSQHLGASRRDRSVRFVRARAGDSLETLVRRWCGSRDPWLDEARALNEDLVVVRVGQEVALPWVEDEVVLAAFEARQPKPVVATPGEPPTAGLPPFVKEVRETVTPAPAIAKESLLNGATPVAAVATQRAYTVKSGDSLWKIANRTYGGKNVEGMVTEIQRLNPDLGETLKVGQKLVLPTVAATK